MMRSTVAQSLERQTGDRGFASLLLNTSWVTVMWP